jgi:hypothetical protein
MICLAKASKFSNLSWDDRLISKRCSWRDVKQGVLNYPEIISRYVLGATLKEQAEIWTKYFLITRQECSSLEVDSNSMHLCLYWNILNISVIYILYTGIAQSIQRCIKGWAAGVRISAGARDLSLLQSVQTGSGTHPANYTLRDNGPFPGRNPVGAWILQDIKNCGTIPPLLLTSSWLVAQLIKHRTTLTFLPVSFCLDESSCKVDCIFGAFRHNKNDQK